VSVINVKDEYQQGENECYFDLTVLFFSASLRYCTPASGI
jgi:hypothetical protein